MNLLCQIWLSMGVAFILLYVFHLDKGAQECVCQLQCPNLLSKIPNSSIHDLPEPQSQSTPAIESPSSIIAERQDSPKLLSYIRTLLVPPSSKSVVLSAINPHKNPHEQQQIYRIVAHLLNNMTNGFYVECGANNGELYSNTLPLELIHNWTGLLIEPDPKPLEKLIQMHRNAWIAPGCLSVKAQPLRVHMLRRENNDLLTLLSVLDKTKNGEQFTVECFPLFSLLKAINVTTVDYFSLDIEGAELAVLKTIPWNSVFIKVLSIEVPTLTKVSGPIHQYMASMGYNFVHHVINSFSHDNIYIHGSLPFNTPPI